MVDTENAPTPDVKENIDIEKFSGRWYEIERTMSVLELGATCVAVNYTDAGYGDGSIEVINEGMSPVLKLRKSVRLVATLPDKNEPAKWSLRLSDLSLKTGYWILDTDYDNYAVIWACNHIWLTFKYARTENLWILSRERTLSEEISNNIHAKLDEMKDIKSRKLLRKVNQENCD
ncbi:Apolipoprotein D like protein [Argiope bruennichi]|uniref:Apolipoprotein D like protein n=1 Tax=Argiope bruennichi TaxID=94029 RepID=A0A8T0EXT4_ARGBR|nr:Apolipoprotein D like protein [Argiope bruennichi]